MKKWWRKYKFFLIVAFIVVSIIAMYGYREYNRKFPDTHSLQPTFQLKALELVNQYETDEQKANAKYADKAISVRGTVKTIQTTDSSATVFLNDGSTTASVICQFERNNKGEVKNLRRGDDAIIKGICSGYLMDVVIIRCVLDQ